MNLGDFLVFASFATALGATVAYAPTLRRESDARLARTLFGVHAALLVAALMVLASHFLGHRFEYTYVAQNSSRELSPALTLAALWAGQEGSILLWAAIGALTGLFLAIQPGRLSAPAMTFAGLAQLFMTGLLLVRSPFAMQSPVPTDGLGLNPLLEDPWMVVHPPVLFLGYAAMLVPFALGAAALVRAEWGEWNRRVWPWALFAVVSLGAGIVLGGVWAYKVLGWGGYWGWDPVENASLVPWLLAVAMLHGLLIQRTLGGAMTRTNLVLAALGWLSVVGGTYLTRSGVLSDFSVHSFSDTGLGPVLTAFLVVSALIAAGLLAWRWRTIAPTHIEWVAVTRESALWLGLMTVVTLAVLVAAGTTMPLLTGLAGKPANVRTEFYTLVTMPLALVVLLLMAAAPALRWTRQAGSNWLTVIGSGAFAGLVAMALAFLTGLRDPLWLALLAATGAMLGINLWVALQRFRRGWTHGAGHLGHVGIAVMALGIAVSGGYGRSQRVPLVQGQTQQVLGYSVTFRGMRGESRGAQVADIRVEKGGWGMDAAPRMMPSPRGDGMMHTPSIDLAHDLYVSPVEMGGTQPVSSTHGEPTWLARGEAVDIGGARYEFRGFRMEHTGDEYLAYGDVDVTVDGATTRVSPGLRASEAGTQPVPADVPGRGLLTLVRMDADHGRIAVLPPGGTALAPTVVIDLSTKPWVNLVWVGALLMLFGTALAGVRRAREQVVREPRRVPVTEVTAEASPKPI